MDFISMQVVPLAEKKLVFDTEYEHFTRLIAYVLKMDDVGNVAVFGLDENGLMTAHPEDEDGFIIMGESLTVGSHLYGKLLKATVTNHGICKDEEEFKDYCREYGIGIIEKNNL